jgi:hypothetical protein
MHVQLGLGCRLEEQVDTRDGANNEQRQKRHLHARLRLHGGVGGDVENAAEGHQNDVVKKS